jgi:N-acetyl-anhydromuramyl-L-alanine amidase AmpD
MRKDTIIIHCSATRENQDTPIEVIDGWHRDRGFLRSIKNEPLKHVGYQYYVRKNGEIQKGRREYEIGAHAKGWNTRSIGICYEGGLDVNGKAKDTRTPEQKAAIVRLVFDVRKRWPIVQIIGHRDTSPDKNKNGKIEPFEWLKECPCYDVQSEWPQA